MLLNVMDLIKPGVFEDMSSIDYEVSLSPRDPS